MRIEPVIKIGFACNCYQCGKRIAPNKERYADLDGPSFKAYYCPDCINKIVQKQMEK